MDPLGQRRSPRLIARRASGLLAALLLLGAAPPPKLLRIGLSTPPASLDPAVARSPEEFAPASTAYRQLVAADGGPEVARSWSSDAGFRVWTMRIAPGQRFASGGAVDAAAVKFSLDRVLAIGRGNAGEIIDHIARVDAIDAMTVRITLRRPTPRLPAILADRSASIVDPAIASGAGAGKWGAGRIADRTAGSGEYRVTSTRGGLVMLARNPHWHGPRGKFDGIVYRVVSDPLVRGMAVARGELDIGVLMPAQSLSRVSRDPAVAVASVTVPAYQNLAFNLARPGFRDARLRRAIAMAIDAPAIIRYIRGGHASRFYGPLAPNVPGHDPALWPYRADPAAAAALARQAQRPDAPVSLIYPGVSAETDTVAQYLQAVLVPLGVKVRIERLSVPAYVDRMQRGSYDLVLMGFVATTQDASGVLNFWFDPAKAGADNPARYSNPVVTRLIAAAASEADPRRRAVLHRQIALIVNRDLPYIYLQQGRVFNIVSRRLTGYRIDPMRPLEVDVGALDRIGA